MCVAQRSNVTAKAAPKRAIFSNLAVTPALVPSVGEVAGATLVGESAGGLGGLARGDVAGETRGAETAGVGLTLGEVGGVASGGETTGVATGGGTVGGGVMGGGDAVGGGVAGGGVEATGGATVGAFTGGGEETTGAAAGGVEVVAGGLETAVGGVAATVGADAFGAGVTGDVVGDPVGACAKHEPIKPRNITTDTVTYLAIFAVIFPAISPHKSDQAPRPLSSASTPVVRRTKSAMQHKRRMHLVLLGTPPQMSSAGGDDNTH